MTALPDTPPPLTGNDPTTAALVTLGCARNEVDSEELAGRLAADGFRLVTDPQDAETVVVNTCGFVEAAKKDSVDTLLEAADLKAGGSAKAVVAGGRPPGGGGEGPPRPPPPGGGGRGVVPHTGPT